MEPSTKRARYTLTNSVRSISGQMCHEFLISDMGPPCFAPPPERGPVYYVVVLVCDDDIDEMHEIYGLAADVVLSHGGSPAEMTPGTIVATFGRPPFDEADARAQARRAAIRAQEITGHRLKIGIGIAATMRHWTDANDYLRTAPEILNFAELLSALQMLKWGECREIEIQ